MSENVEFWNRDKDGNIVPITKDIILENLSFKAEIRKYENLIVEAKSEEDANIFKGVVEELQKEAINYNQIVSVTFTPLLNYELKSINEGKNLGCEGQYTQDVNADVCARHCLNPKYSYEQWRDTKDAILKNQIVRLIFNNSFPEIKSEDETIKKKIMTIVSSKLR